MAEHEKADYDKTPKDQPHSPDREDHGPTNIIGKKSPGVARIEALSAHITTGDRVAIFFGVFLIAYAYGLDGTVRLAYQPAATSKFGQHSLLSSINVVRAVVAAAAQVSFHMNAKKRVITESFSPLLLRLLMSLVVLKWSLYLPYSMS